MSSTHPSSCPSIYTPTVRPSLRSLGARASLFFQSSLLAGMGVPLEAHHAWPLGESEMLGCCSLLHMLLLHSHCHNRAAGLCLCPGGILLHAAVPSTGKHLTAVPVVLSVPGKDGPCVWHRAGSLHTVWELKERGKPGVSTFVAITRGFLVPFTASSEEGIAAYCLCFPFSLTAA